MTVKVETLTIDKFMSGPYIELNGQLYLDLVATEDYNKYDQNDYGLYSYDVGEEDDVFSPVEHTEGHEGLGLRKDLYEFCEEHNLPVVIEGTDYDTLFIPMSRKIAEQFEILMTL